MANEVYCRIDPDGTAHIEEMVPVSLQELQQLRKDAKLGAKVRGMESGTSLFCMRAGQWWLSTRDTEMPICDTPEEALGCAS